MVKHYKAGEFKAKCLRILDDVAREQEAVYVTKRGKLIAAVVPPPEKQEALTESLRGSVVFEDDIISPIDEEWEVDK
ncbi:MAG: type II toxin-antitoxin system Phd/YefM family antitoxin [Proteobacteria bacterium]|nr:type II toxin-antitoxin system Phd/YefM family antitoxin [Pseudomonadota bacterium]